ncbi:MAG: sel1 repeat family protein [Muribaculaceae bacterium]|nr:sel1 repeat family protein [Muribaculaceae bacterium]
MKKLIYAIPLLFAVICFSCKDNSPIQKAVDDYRTGDISEDSLMAYVSDSIRVKETFDWATRHQSKDDIADWLLGRAYKFGLGVDRDPIKSKAYYLSACKAGNGNAMSGLAHIYMSYPGHEDLDSAFYWYNEATKHGQPDAYYHLSQVEIQRYTQNELPIDTAKVIDYWQKGVKLNSPVCIASLAAIYYYGDTSLKPNRSKAYSMLNLVPKDKLNAVSNYLLGEMYELGEVANQSFNTAIGYYKQSAKQGNTNAMCKLGNFYEWGQGVEKNDSLAFIQYSKAANAGNPWGQRCVANCYYSGTGTERNVGTAEQWIKTAAKGGDVEAIKYCDRNKLEYK